MEVCSFRGPSELVVNTFVFYLSQAQSQAETAQMERAVNEWAARHAFPPLSLSLATEVFFSLQSLQTRPSTSFAHLMQSVEPKPPMAV